LFAAAVKMAAALVPKKSLDIVFGVAIVSPFSLELEVIFYKILHS
jgi:hypothetical protein